MFLYWRWLLRSSHRKCSIKKAVLKNFVIFTGTESLLIKFEACKFIKKRLQHWCFTLHVRKFLKTPILRNISERLLLIVLYFSNLFVFGCLFTIIKKSNDLSVKKMFIEIRLYNRMTYVFKGHVKIVKIYMVKFNVSILKMLKIKVFW